MKPSKRYIKDINSIFPFHGKREKVFLKQLFMQVSEYENDHNLCSYNELQNEFGSPIEILKSYYDSIDSDYLLSKMNTRIVLNAFLTGLFVILLILTLTLLVYWYKKRVINDFNINNHPFIIHLNND